MGKQPLNGFEGIVVLFLMPISLPLTLLISWVFAKLGLELASEQADRIFIYGFFAMVFVVAIQPGEERAHSIPYAGYTPNTTPSVTAYCRDGTVTYAKNRQGACSYHGGLR